jgi:hypothetical protein
MDFFLISRGASGASMSYNNMDPKSVSREKIGWLVGSTSSLII